MKKSLIISSLIGAVFLGSFYFAQAATSVFSTFQGGTGTSSPSGILYGDNNATNHLNTVSVGTGLSFSGGILSNTGLTSDPNWSLTAGALTPTTSVPISIPSTGTSTIANLNTQMWVPPNFATSGCAGDPTKTDFGACVNALYSLASTSGNYGVQIMIPNIKVASTQWTTPINFNINGLIASLDCVRGAQLVYGGTGTSTTFNMYNPTGHIVSDNYGCLYMGNTTLIAAGNSNSKTTGGIYLGGSNGAVGVNFHDNTVNGFGVNFAIGANAYMVSVKNNAISGGNGSLAGNNIFIAPANNSGERNVFDTNSITDPGGLIATSSIYISNVGTASNFFTNNSIDNVGFFIGSANGLTEISGNHFENAGCNYSGYTLVQGVSSDQGTQISFNNNEIANDCASGDKSFHTLIQHGGQLTAIGNHINNYGGGTINTFSDHSLDNGLESELICQLQVQGGTLTNIIGGGGPQAYSLAAGSTCITTTSNSYPVSIQAQQNNVARIRNGNQDVGTFDSVGNWFLGTIANAGLITIQSRLAVLASTTIGTFLNVGSLAALNGGASTTQLTATGASWLATLAGSVGIGTTTPDTKLTINGASSFGTADIVSTSANNEAALGFRAANEANSANWIIGKWIGNASDNFSIYGAGSIRASFALNGNVGIGTTTPGTILSLGDTGANTINLSATATSTFGSGINLQTGCFAIAGTCIGNSSFSNTLANGGTATTTFYNGGVVFSDGSKLTQAGGSGVNQLFWDNTNSRLGLGTSSPQVQFDSEISNNSEQILIQARNYSNGTGAISDIKTLNDTGSQLALQMYGSGNTLTITSYLASLTLGNWARLRASTAAAGLIIGTGGSTPIVFTPTDSEAARITSAGLFGIGTSSPVARFTSVAASTTAGTANNGYTGTVSIIAGFENTVVKLFQVIDQWGHQILGGDPPVLTSCGTSPSFVGAANDNAFTVQVGSVAATGCTATFAHIWPAAPTCNVTNRSMSVVNAMTYTISTTALVVSQTGLTGAILDIRCGGTQ